MSGLAFVFASENFNQALRRMRYLRQFSRWKDRQSAAIDSKTSELKSQKESLAKTRGEHGAALRKQQSEQQSLQKQYSRQDAIVAELKANGNALKSHLSRKQAEANELRSRISALIAEEERRAAEERARQEAARKAEEERLAREEAARLEAEAAKEAAAREAELLAENSRENSKREAETRKEQKKLEEAKKKEAKKERKKKKKEKKPNEKQEQSKSVPQNYAEARKRVPGSAASKGVSANATVNSAGNFASMKGSLPKPASGSFKVTSRFGRQSLPDLPDVVYDNPGIDAEVSPGASALAVYGGKVSGVYMIPGYNTVVIVNHGNYYTVYGNILSPAVKVGDQVRAGQGLGALAPDDDDHSRSSIHFEVWKNREKLNPLEWIR